MGENSRSEGWRQQPRHIPNKQSSEARSVSIKLSKVEYESLFLFATSTERSMSGAARFAIKRLLANQ